MPIPKIIHFLWAGGEKILPEENIERVKAWKQKNPEFTVYLWVDKSTSSEENLDTYHSRYKFGEDPKILLIDINEKNVVDEYSRYHINKFLPNYGASSDILRYKILFVFGGALFDSDVIVTEESKPLNYNGLFDSEETEIIRITQFTQNRDVIGNDAFICTPGHPLMKAFYEAALAGHSLSADATYGPYEFDSCERTSWTVGTTGPAMIARVCLSHGLLEKLTDKTSYLDRDRYDLKINGVRWLRRLNNDSLKLDRLCYQPASRNQANWITPVLRKCNAMDEAIRLALECIHFETRYIGFLRIDEFVKNITGSLGRESTVAKAPMPYETEIAEKLVQALRTAQPDLSNCKLIQLATRYHCVASYYQEFTASLHDGKIEDLKTAFSKVCGNDFFVHKQNNNKRWMKISCNYSSHLYKLVQNIFNTNTELLEINHVEQLMKAYEVMQRIENPEVPLTTIHNALNQAADLAFSNCVRKGTHEDIKIKEAVLYRQLEQLITLLNYLNKMIYEWKIEYFYSSLKWNIKLHQKKYPHHHTAIIAILEKIQIIPCEEKKQAITTILNKLSISNTAKTKLPELPVLAEKPGYNPRMFSHALPASEGYAGRHPELTGPEPALRHPERSKGSPDSGSVPISGDLSPRPGGI